QHGLEIFSRFLGNDERYQFPGTLAQRVVGSLPYRNLLTAYSITRSSSTSTPSLTPPACAHAGSSRSAQPAHPSSPPPARRPKSSSPPTRSLSRRRPKRPNGFCVPMCAALS